MGGDNYNFKPTSLEDLEQEETVVTTNVEEVTDVNSESTEPVG